MAVGFLCEFYDKAAYVAEIFAQLQQSVQLHMASNELTNPTTFL